MEGTSKRTDVLLIGVILLLLVLGGVLGWLRSESTILRDFDITVGGDTRHEFVTASDVRSFVDSVCGGSLGYGDVSVGALESYISSRPYIDSVEVFKDLNGKLHLYVSQSRPLFRLFAPGCGSVYVNDRSIVMPLSGRYTADVIPITCDSLFFGLLTGEIKKDKKNSVNEVNLDNLVNFVDWVERNSFWNNQITQINVNSRQEIELIPRAGCSLIILCDWEQLSDFKESIDKLEVFYRRELRQVGADKYRIINVKYKDLIVCTK